MLRLKALLAVLCVYWGTLALLAAWSTRHTGGTLIYMQDDPYIHLAMARNIAAHGVWGPTPHEFGPASSSILWTLLLAGMNLVLVDMEWAPFALNVLSGTSVLILIHHELRHASIVGSLTWSIAIAFATSLPVLAFIGMEHSLHVLVALWTLLAAGAYFRQPQDSRRLLVLVVTCTLLPTARYEGLFQVGAIALAVLMQGRLRHALAVCVAGWSLVGVFGAISLAKGAAFFPNSVLLKTDLHVGATFGSIANFFGVTLFDRLYSSTHVLTLVISAIGILVFSGRRRGNPELLFIYAVTAVLHMVLARALSSFGRYEAYLVATGMFVVARAVYEYYGGLWKSLTGLWARNHHAWTGRVACALLMAFVSAPLARRAVGLPPYIPGSTKNIFEQQYQMAKFVGRYYAGQGLALNDIGAVCSKNDLKLVDLFGLASLEVFHAKRAGIFDASVIDRVTRAHDVRVAILYDSWFKRSGLPSSWVKVAEWRITGNITCSSDTVSFHATRASEADTLRSNLRDFEAQLPSAVLVRYTGFGSE